MRIKPIFATLLSILVILQLIATTQGQENVLWLEDFSTDGDGTRYEMFGRGINAAVTPVRGWDHSFLMPTVEPGGEFTFPARRVAVPWASEFVGYTDPAGSYLDSAVAWAGGGDALSISLIAQDGATNNSLMGGDADIFTRLTTAGYSVNVFDAQSYTPSAETDLLYIAASADATSMRQRVDLRSLPVPIVTANPQAASDLLLTRSVSASQQRQSVQIRANHPATPPGLGLDEMFDWTSEITSLPAFGPAHSGVTTVATYLAPFAAQVDRLAVVDAMIDGRAASVQQTVQLDQADLYDAGNAGLWDFDHPIPGGGGDDYAIVARGTISVSQAGVFGFGLGGDDGGRLRINGADLIVDDTLHGFQYRSANIELPVGDHQFEWVGFERGGDAGFELSVTPNGDQFPTVDTDWDVLSTNSFFSEIGLAGPLEVTRYKLDVANSPLLTSDEPAILAVDGGTTINVPRSPFRTTDGAYLLASGFTDAGFEAPSEPRTISFPAVDISGASDPKLTISLAGDVASYDIEQGTVGLRILVNDQSLVEFTPDLFGTLNDGKFILTNSFKNLTYDLPDNLSEAALTIEVIAPDGDQLIGIDSIRISDGPIEGVTVYQSPVPNSFQQGVNGYSGTVDHEIWVSMPDDAHPNIADPNDLAEILSLDPDGGGDETHILIRFDDIFGEAGIPDDAQIASATLSFEAFDRGDELRLHRMLQDWNTSDTWNSLENGIQPDGVEAAQETEATSGPGKIEIGQVTFDVTESLRLFQENPDENFGWVLLPTGTDGNSLLSSEVHTIPPELLAFVNENVGPLPAIDPLEQIAPMLSFVLATGADCNGDGVVDIHDANCTPDGQLDGFLAALDPPSLRGDADGDGEVQFSDFVILSENFGTAGEYTGGDFDKDGQVQFSDFVILAENFGQVGGAQAAAVPEPSAFALLVLSGLLTGLTRRRPPARR